MTLGISQDTSRFVCDNIARVWEQHLKWQYPDAHTLVILCDGGGSNSSAHRIVKQDLMDLANAAGVVVARDQARHSDITTTNKYIQKRLARQVVFAQELGKWNYLVEPVN